MYPAACGSSSINRTRTLDTSHPGAKHTPNSFTADDRP
jgi:hypothetical protein